MKKKLIAVIAVFIVIASLIVLLIKNNEEGLPELKADNISRVYYEGLDNEFIKDLDIEEFLGYYNQIYDITENKYEDAMEAEELVIELKDGEDISISNFDLLLL